MLYKKEAPRVEDFLYNQGYSTVCVHGDMNQRDRTQAVDSFRGGQIPILIATDVAARGLDIPDVEVCFSGNEITQLEIRMERIHVQGIKFF